MSGGYRKYLRNIIPRMAKHCNVAAILCVSPDSVGVQNWFDPMPNVRFVTCKPFRFPFPRRDIELLRELEAFSPDVIFVPVERPFSFKGVPVVNMLQNMWPMVNFSQKADVFLKTKLTIQKYIARKSVRSSSHIIAVSNFVRDFLISEWGVLPEKIDSIAYGSESDHDLIWIKPEAIEKAIENKFIFTAGSLRADRGLEDLILAAKDIDFNYLGVEKIIIAGGDIPGQSKYKNHLLSLIHLNNLTSRFVFLGNINEAQMKWCYQNCKLFVMTSRVESFGFIGLEAMANGCFCISADNPCLPEIFQEGALYYKPKDAKALANVINGVASLNEDQISDMARRAEEISKCFSWDKAADCLVKVLEQKAGFQS